MAATLRQWEQVVELLGVIYVPGASALPVQQLMDLNTSLNTLKAQPPAHRAVWKKLLQKQVPLRLLKACALQLQRPDVPGPVTAVAACAACVLLSAAFAAGAVVGHHNPSRSSGNSGGDGEGTAAANTALSASLLLQLQQSGLLQQLPAALSAAAQQLERSAAAAKTGPVDAGSEESLQAVVMELLSLVSHLMQLPTEQNDGVAFAPLPAVAGLVLSSLRYQTCMAAAQAAGQQQRQQGAWQQQPFFMMIRGSAIQLVAALLSALDAFNARKARTAGSRSSSSSSSRSSRTAGRPQAAAAADAAVEQVLCSEECFLFLAVWTIGLALHLAGTQSAQHQPESDGSGSSGRGGSGGNSCSLSELPMQLMAVLQQVGCSADVAVEVAQRTARGRAFECQLLDSALLMCVTFADAQELVPELLQGRQQQLGRFALLHQLMCSAMLQLAHMFACLDVQHLDFCSKCCNAAWTCLLRRQQQVQAQRSSSGSSRGNGDHGTSRNTDQHMSTQQQQGLACSSCLQSAQDLLQHQLQLWGSATAALAPADAPTSPTLPDSSSSSSKSSGASTASKASLPAVLQGADGPVVLRCISRTINVLSTSLLPTLCGWSEEEQSAQGASSGVQQQQQQREQTSVRLCALLSQQTRVSIEAVQFSVSSSAVALRQSGQVLATTQQAAAADLLHALLFIGGSGQWVRLRKTMLASSCDLGSPEQRCHFDLLCSLLKLCSIDSNLLQQQPGFSVSNILSTVCSVAAAAYAHIGLAAAAAAAAATTQAGPDVLLQPGTAADTASAAAAAAPAAEQHKAAAAGEGSSPRRPSPIAMLPWLVLLGRCCLLWAQWLQQLSTVEQAEVASAQGRQTGQQARQTCKSIWHVNQAEAAADPWSVLPGQHCMPSTPASHVHRDLAGSGGTIGLSVVIMSAAAYACGWLAAGSNMQQLEDLGYNLQPLLAALVHLHEDAAAIDTAAHDLTKQQPRTAAERAAAEATCKAERASLIGLCPQLQVVGQALTAFAFPLACNNPGCVNASGPSEARLVGGKACVCAGCLTARYCSRACLKQHWKVHKPVCKALAATAAAASSQAAATAVHTQASG